MYNHFFSGQATEELLKWFSVAMWREKREKCFFCWLSCINRTKGGKKRRTKWDMIMQYHSATMRIFPSLCQLQWAKKFQFLFQKVILSKHNPLDDTMFELRERNRSQLFSITINDMFAELINSFLEWLIFWWVDVEKINKNYLIECWSLLSGVSDFSESISDFEVLIGNSRINS